MYVLRKASRNYIHITPPSTHPAPHLAVSLSASVSRRQQGKMPAAAWVRGLSVNLEWNVYCDCLEEAKVS